MMPNVWTVVPVLAVATALARAAFTILPAVISTLIPYRLRARGTAMIGLYVFLFGSFFGAIITGLLSDAYGTRTALVIVVLPSTLIGGGLIALGARHIRGDMAMVVEELREEQAELARIHQPGAIVPVIQVRNLDFAYGKVQVLFDVNLDVQRGETLALLGTNGAGKSTLLRVISGLGVASRGVVRFNGRTVTYADPEVRVKIGIVQLIGGGATFPPLTVEENLRIAAFLSARAEQRRQVDARARDLPDARGADADAGAGPFGRPATDARARDGTRSTNPRCSSSTSCRSGSRRSWSSRCSRSSATSRRAGLTMIIVEQSLNVALAVADRAVFMEKGEIRFEGPAQELAIARRPRARGLPRELRPCDVSRQVLFSGAVTGLTYAVMAVGVILIFRSTRVINFAIGEMGGVLRRAALPARHRLGRALTGSRSSPASRSARSSVRRSSSSSCAASSPRRASSCSSR